MLLPEEVEAKATIPALRAMVAKQLINNYRLTQQQAAEMLGVTQATISNYLRDVRGAFFIFEDEGPVKAMAEQIASMLVGGMDPVAVAKKFHEVSQYIKGRRLMCGLHQQMEPTLEVDACHICDAPV